MKSIIGKIIVSTLLLFIIISGTAGDMVVKQNGDSLKLTCKADGNVINWSVNGSSVNPTESNFAEGTVISTLDRTDLSMEDAGLYECFDKESNLINNYTVTIISISGESASLVNNASLAELSCTVDNDNMVVSSLRWKRFGRFLNDTEEKYSIRTDSLTTSLSIHNPGKEDAGVYSCVVNIEGMEEEFEQPFGLATPPEVRPIEKMRSKVEGEKATILCNVTGFPIPDITWYLKLEDEDEMVVVQYDDEGRVNTTDSEGIPDAKLVIKDLKIKTDRGDYTCVATNSLGTANTTVSLKVKDKLAAVWPFLGICAEVAILCSIIFIFEKRRNRRLEEEEEVDAVKQDLMSKSNGAAEDKEVRQRSNATKA